MEKNIDFMAKTNLELFNDYKVVFGFMHPEVELKGWINEDNFTNIFDEDWNALMEVVSTIKDTMAGEHSDLINVIDDALMDCSKVGVYDAIVEFLKWYNEER